MPSHPRAAHRRDPLPRPARILGCGRPTTPRAEARRFPWNEAKRTARDERIWAAGA